MKKRYKTLIILVVALFFGSIVLQFGYQFLFVKPYEPVLTKGSDNKLNQMFYESENWEDSDFEDAALIAANMEGAIERIDVREDCADFTANTLIRFYLENQHRLQQENKDEIIALYKAKYNNDFVKYEESLSEDGLISGLQVAGKDCMRVSVLGNEERILLVAAYDNLGKGASGAAVECMNLALGVEREKGLVL